jgi:hypothetical protein
MSGGGSVVAGDVDACVMQGPAHAAEIAGQVDPRRSLGECVIVAGRLGGSAVH